MKNVQVRYFTEFFALSVCQAIIFAWHSTLTVFTKALPEILSRVLNVV